MYNKKASKKSRTILSLVWIGILTPFFLSGVMTVGSDTFKTLSPKGFKSLDFYADENTLHLLYAVPAGDEKPDVLYYARSEDGGENWDFSVKVDTGADPPHKPHHGSSPQIAVSGDRIVVVWTAGGTGYKGRGPMASAISTDRGLHWEAGPAPSAIANRGGQAFHDIIADERGYFHNVWLDKRTGNKEKGLYYARSENAGKTWTETAAIDDETCACCWNSLAQGRDGSLYVLYRDANPRDMALAKAGQAALSSVGGGWHRLGYVGAFDWQFDGCPHVGGGLQVVDVGKTKMIHATVWTGKPEKMGLYYLRSIDDGKNWDAPRQLGTSGAWHSDLAGTGDGMVVAVWDAYLDSEREKESGTAVFLSTSTDTGKSWSAPTRLSEKDTSAHHPRVIHVSGGFRVFWVEKAQETAETLQSRMLTVASGKVTLEKRGAFEGFKNWMKDIL